MYHITHKSVILLAAATLLSACKLERNAITLTSDVGDYIGGGQNYSYSNANSIIRVTSDGGLFTVNVNGDESWSGQFKLPDSYSQLQPGSYPLLTRYPFHDASIGGLSWYGEGRGCNTLTGWVTIDKAIYLDTQLSQVQMKFEQHCEGGVPALHGDIRWFANDKSVAPGPRTPAPVDLWSPSSDVLPASGNYVYLESEPGDYIGGGNGNTYLHELGGNTVSLNAAEGNIRISAGGWWGDFKKMDSLETLTTGYYGDLQRFPFHNPAKGGLSWSGNGRGCNTLTGWFVIDKIIYDGDSMTALDLRFAQHCEGGGAALNGKVHWEK